MASFPLIMLGLIMSFFGIFLFLDVRKKKHELDYMHRYISTNVRSLSHGVLAEIKGTVEPRSNVLKTPKTNTECIYYRYLEQELVTVSDKHGRRSEWKTLTDSKNTVPFYISDNTGKIILDLSNYTDIDIPKIYEGEEYDTKDEFRLGPIKLGGGRRLKIIEWALKIGIPLYVFGKVIEDDQGNLHMVKPDDERPFIVSYKTEEELKRERTTPIRELISIVSIIIGILIILSQFFI